MLRRWICAAASVLATAALAGCGGSDQSGAESGSGTPAKGETVITCTGCEDSKTNIFLHMRHLVAEEFNRANKGKYRIEYKPFSGSADNTQSLEYFRRLALSNKLPDLFQLPGYMLTDLGKTGRLVDFKPALDADSGWKDSYYPDAFLSLQNEKGVWGVPETRSVIGVYWNKQLFERAGLSEFPRTWPELEQAAGRLKDAGITPFAMDGEWSTLLWWAHLIGTQEGGVEFLKTGILEGDYASVPAVAQASETLKRLHTEGYVNKDSFAGFDAANQAFVGGKAAMFANGPWAVKSDIKGPNATKGLYDQVAYSIAPGDGVIDIIGEGSWGSGARDDDKKEAVTAFMKFMGTKKPSLERNKTADAYWPTKIELGEDETSQLEPLTYDLVKAADGVQHTYPHALYRTPGSFLPAWKNNWPAYVGGDMSTDDFLDHLSSAVTSGH